jgi:hypothetical protein
MMTATASQYGGCADVCTSCIPSGTPTAVLVQPLLSGTLTDCAGALLASYERLRLAGSNASNLLAMAGFAGARGDTADDLDIALAIHSHLMQQFLVKVRSAGHASTYTTDAASSFGAYRAAADRQGDTPCSITVIPLRPSRTHPQLT